MSEEGKIVLAIFGALVMFVYGLYFGGILVASSSVSPDCNCSMETGIDYNFLKVISYVNTDCEKMGLVTVPFENKPIQEVIETVSDIANCEKRGGIVKEDTNEEGNKFEYCETITYSPICIKSTQEEN